MPKVACLVQTYNDKSGEEYRSELRHLFAVANREFGATMTAGFDAINEDEAPSVLHMLSLGNNIRYMAMADVVVFGKDWETSKMCRTLHDIAMLYNMDIIESYDSWKDEEMQDDDDQATERAEQHDAAVQG